MLLGDQCVARRLTAQCHQFSSEGRPSVYRRCPAVTVVGDLSPRPPSPPLPPSHHTPHDTAITAEVIWIMMFTPVTFNKREMVPMLEERAMGGTQVIPLLTSLFPSVSPPSGRHGTTPVDEAPPPSVPTGLAPREDASLIGAHSHGGTGDRSDGNDKQTYNKCTLTNLFACLEG